jgi:flavin-dependent dehydrogenase
VTIVTDTNGFRETKYRRDPRAPEYSVVMPRLDLDALVAQKAVDAGACLWQRTTVTGPVVINGRVCGVKVRSGGR